MSLPFFLALIAVSHMLLPPDLMAVLCSCLSKLLFSRGRWKKKRKMKAVFLPANTFLSAVGLTKELVIQLTLEMHGGCHYQRKTEPV